MKNLRSFYHVLSFLLLFFLVSPCLSSAAAPPALPEPPALISEQFEKLHLDDLQGYLRQVDRELQNQLSEVSLSQVLASIRRGELDLNLTNLFGALLKFFFQAVLTHSVLLGKLLVLGTILAILEHLQGAFEQNAVARLAHGVGILSLLTVAISSFTVALNTGREAIGNMVGFMHALLPVLLTLMAALGNFSTVALMHPVILISLNVLGTLTRNFVFPLIFCAAVLGIVNHLSERFQVSRLAALFRDGSVVLLSLFLTIFIGILGIQGVAGAVTDGIGLRTAKFLTGAFVPVVGGILSDAVEAVVGCSLFLKNAVGILGALTLLFLCALPIVKILSAAFIYRLAAALMQPLGAQRLGECLQMLGNYLFLVFAAVTGVGLMFLVALTIIVGLGNMVVMLR
ncbi:MAG: stage III sporulation protein AE [Bacillota bacterium]|nr:stage III sporulation protein AE [Bacillota bacterium]